MHKFYNENIITGIYENKDFVINVDFIEDGIVFFRKWTQGSDGSLDEDYAHFICALRLPIDVFLIQNRNIINP